MSVKSDKWIRRMAAKGMIEPFEPIVDPRHFDEKNFVDFRGDVCIIPPNSFALKPEWEGQKGVTLPRI